MTPGEIKQRALALRLPLAQLARRAGKAPESLTRACAGKNVSLLTTHQAFEAALVAEERRLLEHLRALHPAEAA